MLFISIHFAEYEKQALLDTGAIQSATSQTELHNILTTHPMALTEKMPAPEFKVQIANGDLVSVRKQVLLRFFIADKQFEEMFMILTTMGNILTGMSFFKQYSLTPYIRNHLIQLTDVSLQLRKVNGHYNCDMYELRAVMHKYRNWHNDWNCRSHINNHPKRSAFG